MKPCTATSSTLDIDKALTLASDKRFNDQARVFWKECIELLLSLPGECDPPTYGLSHGCVQGR